MEDLRRRPEHSIPRILAWADAYRERNGQWPSPTSGPIADAPGETWPAVNLALYVGLRGLKGGSSLARLLAEQRGVPKGVRSRPLRITEILTWVDAYHSRHGTWPKHTSGPIPESPLESWFKVNRALQRGVRGLEPGSSLAQLLAAHRGVKKGGNRPELRQQEILKWADAFHSRTSRWPIRRAGPIPEAPGEHWSKVDFALKVGTRGLPGGSSLAQFLFRHRGARIRTHPPHLTIAQILRWADAHHNRTGMWPKAKCGPIADAPGETWMAVALALANGRRGLPGGSSLLKLLASKRGVPNQRELPPLEVSQILTWVDAYRTRHGAWPKKTSGPIPGVPNETWSKVTSALVNGTRGLPGGSSLARLLAEHRGVRNPANIPTMSVEQVLSWVDAFHQRTGRWPLPESGPIPEAPGETWSNVQSALIRGTRGMPGGLTIARFLFMHRSVRDRRLGPPLTFAQILRWADAHHERTGCWPTQNSGPVIDSPNETWASISHALWSGARGLPCRSSLVSLIALLARRKDRLRAVDVNWQFR